MKLDLPISLGDKNSSETDYRDNLVVNYTMVARDIKGDEGYLLSHPGLSDFATGTGIDRGGIYNERQDTHLRISGERLISISSTGVVTEIGLISGSQHTLLPYSFKTQGILSNGNFWLYDGVSLIPYTDPDLGSPIDVVWINGVYFFTDGENLFHTTAVSEFNIEPDNFATAEFSPDRTLGLLKNQQNQVVVFNRYTIEWFSDTGAQEGFRFRRIPGKALKVGIVGTNCKAELDGKVFILGGGKEESPSIHIIAGGNVVTVATREVDKIIAGYTESQLQSVVMESRVQYRDKFLIARFPNHTLLYNHTVGERYGTKLAWTIVKTGTVDDAPWRGRNGVFDPRISKWIYGDSIDSKIGFLDENTNAQYGQKMENIFYTPTVNLETFSINELEIDTIPGFHGEPVTAFMSLSFDGVTYGQEYVFLESKQFDYNLRFIGRNIGYIRDNFSLKFRTVTSGRTAFSGLRIEYD